MPKAKAEKGEGKKPAKKGGAKKEKKKKDPNAPKKPLSAYMFFCAEHRDVIKKEQPDLKVTEVTSQLGKAWAALDEAAKKKFYEKAEKDKERYKKAIDSYKKADSDEEEEEPEEEDEDDD